MNYDIAKRIMDEKPTEAQHLYIDEHDKPRDKHIENLFRDTYSGVPLDDLFRNNFEVYFQELTGHTGTTVPRMIFIDADTAMRWVNKHVGTVTVRELTARERKREGRDPERAHLRYIACIQSGYADKVEDAYAPSKLHAVLLAAIMVFRSVAGERLDEFFAEALLG